MAEEYTEEMGQPSISEFEEQSMSEEDFLGYIRSQMTDAVDYVDQFLSPDRNRALEYFQSKEFGDEESGRSQYVDSTLRDTVNAIMPSLLKIFFSRSEFNAASEFWLENTNLSIFCRFWFIFWVHCAMLTI